MSNVNNYFYSNKLEEFKKKVLEPQIARTAKAEAIMHDPNYKWETPEKKEAGQVQYDNYKNWQKFYQEMYDEGVKLCTQHENLVNKVSKWYDRWYADISNEGKQEVEMMSMQADELNEIFTEMFNELKPLNLDIPAPKALNFT